MSDQPKRPSVDLVVRGDKVSVVVSDETRNCHVGDFDHAEDAGTVAMFLTGALHKSYMAGMDDAHKAALRALDKIEGKSEGGLLQ